MKIAIIAGYWNPPNFRGGISRVIFQLRKEWEEMGHTVHIYALNTVPNKKNGIFRVPIPPVPLRAVWMNLYMLLFSPLDQYDILFPQSGLQALFFDKERCIPFIHTLYNVEHLVPWRFWKYAIGPLEEYALRNIKGCITSDTKTMNALINKYHASGSKILKIHNGVDYTSFGSMSQKRMNDFVILSVGRFIPRKRFELLIEAFALFAKLHVNAKLVIAGDGALKGKLHRLVNHLDITDKVRFPGMVDTLTLLELYQSASIFVLPSIAEGMPIVVLEAQACALPVVLGDFESAYDLVIEGETGYILSDVNPETWAQVFNRFYEQPDLIKTFGEASLNRIKKEYLWSAVAQKIIVHFQNILAEVSKT